MFLGAAPARSEPANRRAKPAGASRYGASHVDTTVANDTNSSMLINNLSDLQRNGGNLRDLSIDELIGNNGKKQAPLGQQSNPASQVSRLDLSKLEA